MSQGSSVCTMGWAVVQFLSGAVKGIFFSPLWPDKLGVQPTHLSSRYQGLFPWWHSSQHVKLTANFHLVP